MDRFDQRSMEYSTIQCRHCSGTGIVYMTSLGEVMSVPLNMMPIAPYTPVACDRCHGMGFELTGEIWKMPPMSKERVMKKIVGLKDGSLVLCNNCNGRGHVGNANYMECAQCAICLGEGVLMSDASQKEAVHHPQHYNEGKYEVIDVIEDWRLSFNLGNAVKYIARHEHKGRPAEDLEKAWWYLTRELLAKYRVRLDLLAGKLTTIVRYETARDIEVDEEAELP